VTGSGEAPGRRSPVDDLRPQSVCVQREMPAERHRAAAPCRLTVALLALAFAGQTGATPAGLDLQTGWSVSSPESIEPGDITVGADRNLWFPETGTNRIGRITTMGDVEEFTIPDASALGRVIAPGPDGKIWVLGSGLDGQVHAWAVDASGLSVEIASLGDNPALGTGFLPAGITAGPDGNVWISKLSSIARVSPAGQVTEFPIGGDAIPTSITSGPDAHLWFVDSIGPFVARRQELRRVSTDGVIEQVLFAQNRQGLSAPSSIITGPDGNLWFADNGYSEIARVTVNPLTRTVFPFVGPSELAAGPDGNIWITAYGRRSIARMTPAGALTEFELPLFRSNPLGIAAGPDGNIWFTEPDGGAVGRITPEGAVTEFAIGPARRFPVHRPRSPRTVGNR
jgi:streptogramin lyase